MKKLLMFFAVLALALSYSPQVEAQGFLKNLGKKVVEKAKEKAEQKVLDEEDKAIDSVLNGKGDANEEESDEITPKKAKKQAAVEESDDIIEAAPTAATTSDFKRGEVILFEDDVKAEQVGEFPSKWDLLDGNAEVKTLGGAKAIEVTNNGVITPYIKEEGAYLPEEFTIEYEFYYWDSKEDIGLNDT